jgi:carbamate kinase
LHDARPHSHPFRPGSGWQVGRIKHELALEDAMPLLEAVAVAEAMVGCALAEAPSLRARVDRILAQL